MPLIHQQITSPSALRVHVSIVLILILFTISMIASVSAENIYKTSTISTVRTILDNISRIKQIREELVPSDELPFLCVTYAQTLDGNIAIHKNKNQKTSTSSNLNLSSEESFLLTHALRSQFDGILIGGNTLRSDNPRLNNRLWAEDWHEFEEGKMVLKSTSGELKQPIPIILDTHLRHVMDMVESSHFIKAAVNHELIIVCCSQEAYDQHRKRIQSHCVSNNFAIELLPCASNDSSPGLDLEDVVYNLCMIHGIYSIMVEGGASVLSGFLSNRELVDCVCVTICPRMVGACGLNALGSANVGSKDDDDAGKVNGSR